MATEKKSQTDYVLRAEPIAYGITMRQAGDKLGTIEGQGKERVDTSTGHEFDVRGRLWKKQRTIDKPNDRYLEHVEGPVTGEVLHHTDEPLSQHTGHGAAKPRTT